MVYSYGKGNCRDNRDLARTRFRQSGERHRNGVQIVLKMTARVGDNTEEHQDKLGTIWTMWVYQRTVRGWHEDRI